MTIRKDDENAHLAIVVILRMNRIYCYGHIDLMTDDPLPECLACPDHVSHAQDDYDKFIRDGGKEHVVSDEQ